MAPPLATIVAFHEMLGFPISLVAIALGLCLSCALFLITSKRDPWHWRFLAVASFPSVLAVLVVIAVALTSGPTAGGAGTDPKPAYRRPVPEQVLPLAMIPGTFVGEGSTAYAFDLEGLLVRMRRRFGTWTIERLRHTPLPGVTAMERCGASFAVAYNSGEVARIARNDGVVLQHRRLARQELSLACVGPWLFAARRLPGGILRLKTETLEAYSDWVRTETPVDAITAGRGRVFIASRSADRVGVIEGLDDTFTEDLIDWTDDVVAPNGLLVAAGQLFVSHAGAHCVTRMDMSGDEVMPGMPTGGGLTHLASHGEDVYSLNEDSGALVTVTEKRSRRIGSYVKLAPLPVAVAVAAGRLLVADGSEKETVRIFTFASLRAATRSGHLQLGAVCH
jgi:hypothetical protein